MKHVYGPLGAALLVSILVLSVLVLSGCGGDPSSNPTQAPGQTKQAPGQTMQIHYLEIVTPDVDATCATYERLHGVTFGDPVPEFGNARTATLAPGGTIGVRAPLRETEQPIVRPYALVKDIKAAAAAVAESGGTIALPPTEIPGRGTIVIYLQGGIEHGLWQK